MVIFIYFWDSSHQMIKRNESKSWFQTRLICKRSSLLPMIYSWNATNIAPSRRANLWRVTQLVHKRSLITSPYAAAFLLWKIISRETEGHRWGVCVLVLLKLIHKVADRIIVRHGCFGNTWHFKKDASTRWQIITSHLQKRIVCPGVQMTKVLVASH